MEGGEAVVSSISVWEIGMLFRKGRIEFAVSTAAWVQDVEKTPGLRFLPVENRIALLSQNLPGELHSDPVDRIIVALAHDLERRSSQRMKAQGLPLYQDDLLSFTTASFPLAPPVRSPAHGRRP